MQRWLARYVALSCVVACATVAAVSVWPKAGHVRTEDRNGDGRPDVWHQYDDQGQATESRIDTNFDGRSDIHEYYQNGTLVRRESDRNFDDQVDLVEEFDAATHEHIRSVVDIDYDGTADLLVLFRDGLPVFAKRVCSLTTSLKQTSKIFAHDSPLVHRHGNADRLAPLTDPFRAQISLRGTRAISSSHDDVGVSASGGLPASRIDAASPIAPSARLAALDVQAGALARCFLRSSRGPPLS
jgi:hypothetical protein